jgi:hypothetical protein
MDHQRDGLDLMASAIQQLLLASTAIVTGATITALTAFKGASTAGVITYASAVTCGANDIVVIAVEGSNGFAADNCTAVSVGGVGLTAHSSGYLRNDLVVVGGCGFFYGKPGAMTNASIAATMSAGGTNSSATIMAWVITGNLNGTPVSSSQVGSSSANSTSAVLSSVHESAGGFTIGVFSSQPTSGRTVAGSWSGSESFVEDYNTTDNSGNCSAVAGHIATTTGTAANLTFTITGSAAQHVAEAISFGP